MSTLEITLLGITYLSLLLTLIVLTCPFPAQAKVPAQTPTQGEAERSLLVSLLLQQQLIQQLIARADSDKAPVHVFMPSPHTSAKPPGPGPSDEEEDSFP